MDYQKEFEQLEEDIDDEILIFITMVSMQWSLTAVQIGNLIENYYSKYATNNILTFNAARKYLTLAEVKEFNRIMGTNRLRISRLEALELQILRYMTDMRAFELDCMRKAGLSVTDLIVARFDKLFDLDPDEFDLEKLLASTWGDDDLNWNDRIRNHTDKTAQVIVRNTKDAILNRREYNWLSEKLSKVNDASSKWSKYELENEAAYFSSALHYQLYKKIGASHYTYCAREDEKLCEICRSLDGKVFPIAAYEIGVTAPLMHNHCRCYTIPNIG